jgi:nitrogen fixation/metabolism regulation signal transduction histidine kinase
MSLRARLLLGFLLLSLAPTAVLTAIMLEQIDQAHRTLVHSPGVEQSLESALVVSKTMLRRAESSLHGLAEDGSRTLGPGVLAAAERDRLGETLRAAGADFAQTYRRESAAWVLVDEVLPPGVLATQRTDLGALLPDALAGDGLVRSGQGALAAVALLGRDWAVVVGDRVPPDFFERMAAAGQGAGLYRQIGAYSKVWRGVLLVWALGLSALLAMLSLWLSARLATQLTRPVAELAGAFERVAGGDLGVRVRPAGAREIKQLGVSFNQMAEGLAGARAELARAERKAAWGGIARRVAHEIRNALTPMGSSLHLLRKRVNAVASDERGVVEENLDALAQEVEGLSRMAEEFSDLGRLPEPSMAPLDLATLARRTGTLHRRPGYDLTVAEPVEPVWVRGDGLLLGRVLHNLIINAREAMSRGGAIELQVERRGSLACVEVRDRGPGIPEGLRGRVLEPYTSTKERGSGLGLAFSRDVVDQHGGELELESRPGGGTVVRVLLPLAPAADASPGKESTA